ncbi:Bacterial alpha-L-rhamnosidase [Hymenobacter busanensis]|uniref:alpha-L-rhamnosidase n=1 Tax=Hymenobacter busanensis TaxID=2607656 RepID=A0A7L4ZU90_9BACT|nr:family 78 glycoside hydrolase catalytic domain [Hymenobacter busanensis]KAA9339517.1 Bacterial alpha-L-rhamnosidase [Hymenobacter busanensis]QHJ06728.1 family 78 glycoside hydrolase catalytic domain [Hymenobacter busanensis]
MRSFLLVASVLRTAALSAGLLLSGLAAVAGAPTVSNLRCGYRPNPLGVQQTAPNLSWELQADHRNARQSAYRLLVADDEKLLSRNQGNVWDSQQTASAASIQVPYAGPALQATKTYYWKVMVWDERQQASGWSQPARWQMGLLTAADWRGARWIAYEQLPAEHVTVLPVDGKKDAYQGGNVLPLLRKGFTVKKKLRRATAYVCGLGQFELHLNGQKVGDHFLDPAWTKYDRHAQYVTFDVTGQLRRGANAVGVLLGNGFYYVPPVKGRYRKLKTAFGYPKLLCRVQLDYQDGTQDNVVSDASWQTAPGPVTFSSIYGGEDYDARREQPGWDAPRFKAAGWKPVLVVDGPARLDAQQAEPLRVHEQFQPRRVSKPQPGRFVYDFGQNASGIVELQVQGRAGDTVRLAPAELLTAGGLVTQKNSGGPYYFTYVLRGAGVETWRPRFSYYGFRYAQLEGGVPAGETNPTNRPVVRALSLLHTRNAAPEVGAFSCSNELLNQTNTLIDWSVKSNMASVFTDCPHREKLGWQEQNHLMGSSIRYRYDIAALSRKVIQDLQVAQLENGLVPEIAPEFVKFEWGGDMFRDSPEWGSSAILLPWYVYQWYGDRQVLEGSYPMMQRYAAYLATKAQGHILSQGLGDWYDLGPKPPGVSQLTPMGVTGTAIYYYDLTTLAGIARLLGKPEDAARYDKLAAEVRTAFNAKFFNPETKQYASGSQAANAVAVYMGLVAPEHQAAVVGNLVRDIQSRNNALTAGDIGYRYVLRVLEDAGRSDVIYAMNSRADVPGYGYQLAQGATALTESWAALPTVSNNHLMLGHLQEWLYGGLAGIRPAAGSVAFNQIDIRPEPVGDVTSARATHLSPYGLIGSEWQKTAAGFELTCTIPANTTATVYLPAASAASITESGQPLTQQPELKLLGVEGGRARIAVGSGVYRFVATQLE